MNLGITDHLLERLRAKDPAAMQELMHLTRRFAWETVYRMTRSREESMDIIQEAYIRVWKNIGQLDQKGSFTYWFRSILRNLSIDWMRKNKKLSAVMIRTDYDPESPGSERSADREMELSELIEFIKVWIPGLPETQQTVFVLRDMENLSIREVMDETGLTESSIKSSLYIARKKLKEDLIRAGHT
jgi:RNA polymerase sigma-70 factor (ECF subfamily)